MSELTRQQVQAAAARLGFEFNALARGLSRGRSGMVGVLLSDIRSPYLAEVVFAAESKLRELGFGIIIADTANSVSVPIATAALRNGRIDGLISLIPMSDDEIEAFTCPIVFADRPRNNEDHDSVTFDNHSGGMQAAEHLRAVGATTIAFIDSPETPATRARREGFLEAAAGLSMVRVDVPGRGLEGGRSAVRSLLDSGVDFNGVFATNDMLALGVIQELAEVGRRVPDDVAVVGFDGTYVGTISAPTLSTVFQDANRLGASVAELLATRIEDSSMPPSSVVLPVTLVARQSSATSSARNVEADADDVVDPDTALRTNVEYVLFDCDGVLVDSEPSIERCWSRWAEVYGQDAAAVVAAVPGRRAPDVIAQFLPSARVDEAVAVIERLELADAENVRSIPGAAELLGSIPRHRWAVVTSGTSTLAARRLASAGLPLPDVLIAAEDVTQGKPHPEGYLIAGQRLGAEAARTAVLEDSAAGIAAAIAAGMGTVIGVGAVSVPGLAASVSDLAALNWTGGRLSVSVSTTKR